MRGTTDGDFNLANWKGISTHVPHAGHDAKRLLNARLPELISTHVPHAGHDCSTLLRARISPYISTHVPHAGHDVIL